MLSYIDQWVSSQQADACFKLAIKKLDKYASCAQIGTSVETKYLFSRSLLKDYFCTCGFMAGIGPLWKAGLLPDTFLRELTFK